MEEEIPFLEEPGGIKNICMLPKCARNFSLATTSFRFLKKLKLRLQFQFFGNIAGIGKKMKN